MAWWTGREAPGTKIWRTSSATRAGTVGDLIDRGAVPGDLVARGTGFEPWRGTKEARLRRIATETEALGRLPETGEVAWIHCP
jgi:hypothetical protein